MFYNFWFDSHHSYNSSIGFLSARGLAGANQAIMETNQSHLAFAKALPAGVRVGPSDNFGRYAVNRMLACRTTSYLKQHRSGPWINVANKFLGLKFIVNGQIHYGWARLTVHQVTYCKVRAELSGYAYESDANTPIATGQTSAMTTDLLNEEFVPGPSLAALSLGAPALEVWRREDEAPAQ